MNQELKEQANAALTTLIEDFTNAREFAIEQAPQVIEELLRWHFWSSLLLVILGAILTAEAFYFVRSFILKGKWDPFGLSEGEIGCFISLSVGVGVMGFSIFCCQIGTLLKVCIAPRLFLIEYAAGLI